MSHRPPLTNCRRFAGYRRAARFVLDAFGRWLHGRDEQETRRTGGLAAIQSTPTLSFSTDVRSPIPPTATLAYHSDNPIYRIFLYDPSASVDLTAWFAAGANDALRVPVSRGELLARIRAGARMLEFENRMRSQSSRSRLPGMYSAAWSACGS